VDLGCATVETARYDWLKCYKIDANNSMGKLWGDAKDANSSMCELWGDAEDWHEQLNG
jgi:hypothetical protein